MILFMAKHKDVIKFASWLDNNLNSKKRNKLFPVSGEYEIYVVLREFLNEPIISEVDSIQTPRLIKDGWIAKYVVK